MKDKNNPATYVFAITRSWADAEPGGMIVYAATDEEAWMAAVRESLKDPRPLVKLEVHTADLVPSDEQPFMRDAMRQVAKDSGCEAKESL